MLADPLGSWSFHATEYMLRLAICSNVRDKGVPSESGSSVYIAREGAAVLLSKYAYPVDTEFGNIKTTHQSTRQLFLLRHYCPYEIKQYEKIRKTVVNKVFGI